MASTTIGVKIDEPLRQRLRDAAESAGRTTHGFAKQAILSAVERSEADPPPAGGAATQQFLDFAHGVQPQSVLRARITAACRIPEPEAVPLLLAGATLAPAHATAADALAASLVAALRAKSVRGGVEGLIQEYDLSSQEGVALMCLAEALLRIPDRRHARRADPRQDQHRQLAGACRPERRALFVNAATWGLVVTGRLTATTQRDPG